MTDVLIKRELLERIDESAICDGTDATISNDLFTQLVAALAAPRQPEVEGLEVVAYRYKVASEFGGDVMCWAPKGRKVLETFPLADHAAAERAIAELREECERLTACIEIRNQEITDAGDSLSALRQQLAERDAQIASMRAEVTPFIETHWRPVAVERDTLRQQMGKLAGLLREAINWDTSDELLERIDAALAEVK